MENEPAPKPGYKFSFNHIRIALWLLVAAYAGYLVWANSQKTEIDLLFLSLNLRKSILVIITIGIGFILGWLLPGMIRRRRAG